MEKNAGHDPGRGNDADAARAARFRMQHKRTSVQTGIQQDDGRQLRTENDREQTADRSRKTCRRNRERECAEPDVHTTVVAAENTGLIDR